jgi:small subunit ribosomal protein S9
MAKESKQLITGTGRRKTAVARVFFTQDKGEMTVNGIEAEKFFPQEKDLMRVLKPFHTVGISHPKAKYGVSVKVEGSGRAAQIGAIAHGISRALAELDPEFAKALRKQGLLTRDSRMVERKKPYLHKARKAPQYSKR